jgi:hypothetical protein
MFHVWAAINIKYIPGISWNTLAGKITIDLFINVMDAF